MVDTGVHGLDRREFLRRTGVAAAAVALPSGLLTACGGGSDTGGTLKVGATDWLPPDFFIQNSLGAHLIGYSQVAWALFMGGGGDGKGWEFSNGLASGYHVSGDGLTHTVTLRKGLTFHDGSPIDAEAVAANLKGSFFAHDPLHRGSATYVQIAITLGDPPIVKSVEPVDDHTVAIRLKEFRFDIRNPLALTMILSPDTLRMKDYGTNVKALSRGGSGPFRLTRWVSGDFAEFERWDGFFEKVVPERVRLQQIADPGALALALKRGDIGVAAGLNKADFDRLSRSGYHAIVPRRNVNLDLIFSHPKDPAFADKRVRRAVWLAMNRQAYSERFFSSGTASVSSQPILSPSMPGYVDALHPEAYDPDAAKALMAEAGVNTAKLSIMAPTAQAPISSTKDLLEAMAADLGQIGIDVHIDVLDSGAQGEAVATGKAEAFISAPGGGADPMILFDLYVFGPYAPGALRSAPSITRDLTKAHTATNLQTRDALLRDVIETLSSEALMVPISVASYSALATSKVHDFPLTCTQLDSWNKVSVDG